MDGHGGGGAAKYVASYVVHFTIFFLSSFVAFVPHFAPIPFCFAPVSLVCTLLAARLDIHISVSQSAGLCLGASCCLFLTPLSLSACRYLCDFLLFVTSSLYFYLSPC